jgi:NitT/TauT family transport system permease protein
MSALVSPGSTGTNQAGALADVTAPSRWRARLRSLLPPGLTVILLVALWELFAHVRLRGLQEGSFAYKQKQSYLPYAHKVFIAYIDNADSFLRAGLFTFGDALVGFVLGAFLGYGLALLMSSARWVEKSFYLYIVGSQMVPVIALAPILYGIIRNETLLKITVAAYLTFFPVTVNVLRGLRSVDPQALDLMRSYAASPWENYLKLRMPAAMPFFFNALKVASTGSLIGAIVAELMGGNSGLGVLLLSLQYNSYGASDKLWALVIEVAIIGVLFFGLVSAMERLLVPSQPELRRPGGYGGRSWGRRPRAQREPTGVTPSAAPHREGRGGAR